MSLAFTFALCLLLQRYTFWSNSQLAASIMRAVSYCACYCKDTHFEAIHNRASSAVYGYSLCLLLQRYTFWSNSQPDSTPIAQPPNCACYCKDTHFEAIHNCKFWSQHRRTIVLATAKIHILKQFTTRLRYFTDDYTLCLLLQRYTFWSNSQQVFPQNLWVWDCACYCKDTHFEAIHNSSWSSFNLFKLCLLLQRYTFWSNSQRLSVIYDVSIYCACYCKDTHFEAIHNSVAVDTVAYHIVLATAKIHILKQFTTVSLSVSLVLYCACYCKDTHFEAIHNPQSIFGTKMLIVLATAKIHILKQFTTPIRRLSQRFRLCLLLQRYTFWSNSQLRSLLLRLLIIVLATAKIHILKQFTT